MIEPSTATASAFAKAADAIKDWPLWLFSALASCLTVFVAVPEFRELVSPPVARAVLFGAVSAWIFTGCRAVTPAARALRAYREESESRIRYVITPVEHQCIWHMAKQPDGSIITQISGNFLVHNRTDDKLYLTTPTLIKPKIPGPVLHRDITMRAPDSNMHGSADVSGYFIPPRQTWPATALIMIRATPKQKFGVMPAVIEFAAASGDKECVTVQLNNPAAP